MNQFSLKHGHNHLNNRSSGKSNLRVDSSLEI